VPITRPAAESLQISPDLPASNRAVLDFQISPDSQRGVYKADVVYNDCYDLFSVPNCD
jgi:hypothetical protein